MLTIFDRMTAILHSALAHKPPSLSFFLLSSVVYLDHGQPVI